MGSWPRRYGVPKIHKKDYLLKPILATIGSAQHKIAQYLSRLLQPVSDLYSVFCVKDVNLMKYFKNNSFSLKTVCLLYKVVENWRRKLEFFRWNSSECLQQCLCEYRIPHQLTLNLRKVFNTANNIHCPLKPENDHVTCPSYSTFLKPHKIHI